MDSGLLRNIPKVDDILALPGVEGAEKTYGREAVVAAVRTVLDAARDAVLQGAATTVPDAHAALAAAVTALEKSAQPHLRRVVNATGIILHTNLGRAPLARGAAEAAREAAAGYSNLEYIIEEAKRGSRHSHVDALLCELTGAEAAMVVNNNAAAVLLALSAMAKGGEVVVSRGELVEIGGSFRIPEIMELSGATLKEVGATNRTHPADYERAIGENTTALFKAHPSNFRLEGFTSEVSLAELVEIGKQHGVPVIYDLGGGGLYRWQAAALPNEPSVEDSLEAGPDILTFSGDKLLGGPQAGVVLGKQALVEKLKKHPFARAMRVDKMTLAALEATLRLYRSETLAKREVPTLAMLYADETALRQKAETLLQMLPFLGADAEVTQETGQLGAGSAPMLPLASWAVAITREPVRLEAALRGHTVPVIGRIAHDKLILDVRTIKDDELTIVADTLQKACKAIT